LRCRAPWLTRRGYPNKPITVIVPFGPGSDRHSHAAHQPEAGLTGFDMDSWVGVFAPAGTPREIVVKLNTELCKIIDNPETKAKVAALGFEAFSSSPEELDAHVKVQLERWTKMIKDTGIPPQ
jgi:tripartite-type tricarboxylate transporter receptor subunit TctC